MMNNVLKLILPALLFLFLVGCDESSSPETTKKDELLAIPAHNLHSYDYFDPAVPVAERVRAEDDFTLDLLADYGLEGATYYEPTEAEIEKLAEYFRALPPLSKRVLEERCLAIYFINDFFASGMTDYVLDPASEEVYCTMFFDRSVLKKDMQTWLNDKENTCFVDDREDIEISVELTGGDHLGMLPILIHESTHAVDYVCFVTPYTEPDVGEVFGRMRATSAFTDGIWTGYRNPVARYEYFMRGDVTFYGNGGPKISESDAEPVYRALAETPFVSLYGSMSWAEDLAEYVAFYHMTQKLGISHSVKVIVDGEVAYEFDPFASDAVADRIDALEMFYE